jgi:DNA adenine methylase
MKKKRKSISSPLKWHGGKSYLAKRIVELMPPHKHYVEPYAGGLSVLLEKDPEGVSEVVNDIHAQLTMFWRVLQNDKMFKIFVRDIAATPFSEHEFHGAKELFDESEPVACAINFFIRCRQSLAGRMQGFALVTRSRTRRGMNEQVSAWLSAVEGLPEVHARMKRVLILNRDALAVIKQQDGPDTLFYLDPTYLHETRATIRNYAHEMTTEQHQALLAVLSKLKGKFLLSGYRSKLYDTYAKQHGWTRHEFAISNHASGAKTKRKMIECVWANF